MLCERELADLRTAEGCFCDFQAFFNSKNRGAAFPAKSFQRGAVSIKKCLKIMESTAAHWKLFARRWFESRLLSHITARCHDLIENGTPLETFLPEMP